MAPILSAASQAIYLDMRKIPSNKKNKTSKNCLPASLKPKSPLWVCLWFKVHEACLGTLNEMCSFIPNCDSGQDKMRQPLDCVSVCSWLFPVVLCVVERCREPQWKRSILHIPATWDSSVSVMLHCPINTFSEGRAQAMLTHREKHDSRCFYLISHFILTHFIK